LGGERDFRDEDDGALAFTEGVVDGLEVDLGFAAAGDAMEEEDGVGWGGGVHGGDHSGEGGLLVGVERERLSGEDEFAGVGVAFGDLGCDGEESFIFESTDGIGGGLGEFEEFLEREFAPFLEDAPDFLLTGGEFRQGILLGDGVNHEAFAPALLFFAHGIGQDAFEGGFHGATIVVADPAGEIEDFGSDEALGSDGF